MSEYRLEPWGEGDLPLLERLMGDPVMTEHLGGPEPPEKIAERHVRYERMPESGGGQMFKVVDSETGEAVGSIGYWEREDGDELVYETGWAVLPEFQGRGIATEATALVIERGPGAEEASVVVRVPVGRERAVECDLPQARLRAGRHRGLRVPQGQRQHHALQRLAPRPLGELERVGGRGSLPKPPHRQPDPSETRRVAATREVSPGTVTPSRPPKAPALHLTKRRCQLTYTPFGGSPRYFTFDEPASHFRGGRFTVDGSPPTSEPDRPTGRPPRRSVSAYASCASRAA